MSDLEYVSCLASLQKGLIHAIEKIQRHAINLVTK